MTKPKKIILIGARMDGQAGVVSMMIKQFALFDIAALIDDDTSLHKKELDGIPVAGGIDQLARMPKPDGAFICIGDNNAREKLFGKLTAAGIPLVNVVHPSAIISSAASIGTGVFVGPGAVIMNGVTLGNGVTINTATTIDHDNTIEDFATVSPGSHTSGRTRIKTRAFLGTGTIVIPEITIGRDAFVGAGSVVTHDVPDGVRVAGVPAKRIG